MLNTAFKCSQASEPTDIIWENRGTTPAVMFKKRLIAIIASCFMLYASFQVLYFVVTKQIEYGKIFPSINCTAIKQDYGTHLESAAYSDWKFVFKSQEPKVMPS